MTRETVHDRLTRLRETTPLVDPAHPEAGPQLLLERAFSRACGMSDGWLSTPPSEVRATDGEAPSGRAGEGLADLRLTTRVACATRVAMQTLYPAQGLAR